MNSQILLLIFLLVSLATTFRAEKPSAAPV